MVLPTVSWQAEEYEALGVDFRNRGKMLDEHLEIWKRLWTDGSPISFDGDFYRFSNIHIEPSPHSPGGPTIWTGGKLFSPWMVRRVVAYGNGLFPIVPPSEEQFTELDEAMKRAGRDMSELELVAQIPTPMFTDATGLLDLDETLANVPDLVAKGFTTLLLKPSMFIDDGAEFEDFCRTAIRKIGKVVDA